MSTFSQELFSGGLYKRSQGRITRQVTFAVIFLGLAAGLWRLSQTMIGVDPVIKERKADVTWGAPGGHAPSDAVIKVIGVEGAAQIKIAQGDTPQKIAQFVEGQKRATGVTASVADGELHLASVKPGAAGFVGVKVESGSFEVQGLDAQGLVHGGNALNLGLRFAIPGLLMVLGTWIAYRMVNIAAFADFLIAVEAEMNKVSWPSRQELFRASIVVLLTIFALAVILFAFDSLWWLFFHTLHII